MGQPKRHVIIGAGLAGARTAEALRAAGSQGTVDLVERLAQASRT